MTYSKANSRSLAVSLASAGLLAAAYVAVPFSTLGCGDCVGTCLTAAFSNGGVTLPDTATHVYDVQYCVGTHCGTYTLSVEPTAVSMYPDNSMSPTEHSGFVTRTDSTHLSLQLIFTNLTMTAGDPVTVTITDKTTNAVILDIARTLPSVEQVSRCSDVCDQSTVNWN